MPFQFVDRTSYIVNRKKKNVPDEPALPAGRPLTINYQPAFTLIELLVVIAILGILASFTSFALIGHQKKARDAQRKSDMQVFKKTMELAKSNCRNSAYYPRISPGSHSWALEYYNNAITYFNNAGYKISDKKDPLNPDNVMPTPSDNFARFYGLVQESTPGPSAVYPQSAVSGLNLAGKTNFVAFAKLEISSDKDAASSKENCQNAANQTGLPIVWNTGGYYYVCSE